MSHRQFQQEYTSSFTLGTQATWSMLIIQIYPKKPHPDPTLAACLAEAGDQVASGLPDTSAGVFHQGC